MSINNQIVRLDRELTKFRSRCMSLSNQRRLFETEELQALEEAHNKVKAALLDKVADLAHRYYNFGDLTTARRLRDIALADDDSFFVQAAADNTLH